MKVVSFHEFGDPSVLRPAEAPEPVPGRGEVLIDIEAVSVGFAQTQMRRDLFPAPMWKPSFPVVLGGDVVGRVAATGPGTGAGAGPDTGTVRLGDRVAAFTLHGGYAEKVVVPLDTLLPVPDGLDAVLATALPGTGPIAMGTLDTAPVRPGDRVLVQAAAGGIGHLSVQLARLAGAGQVIGTAGSTAKRAFVESLGVDVVVDHTDPGWVDTVREATHGEGVDVVLDGVGGDLLPVEVGLLAPFGRLVFYGSAGGGRSVPPVSLMTLIGMRFVTGFALSAWRAARPKEYLANHRRLVELLVGGELRQQIHTVLPLAEAARAHEIMESRAYTGRIILTVS
ncbi:zinc-binding dehydrogenase [Frankia sp. AiPs1]|uniref:quinone oxidoreductase family protein n=1 Tax=Frankia sp. AiPs1 TaxID=573493 RepID=UPI0020436CF6|nr:zinc-binding dehydrogenase [Frankia sp. AiPs1]MCM3920967.1 zinc-binding dehydrogenase [Frankia sp. AiPs1]